MSGSNFSPGTYEALCMTHFGVVLEPHDLREIANNEAMTDTWTPEAIAEMAPYLRAFVRRSGERIDQKFGDETPVKAWGRIDTYVPFSRFTR